MSAPVRPKSPLYVNPSLYGVDNSMPGQVLGGGSAGTKKRTFSFASVAAAASFVTAGNPSPVEEHIVNFFERVAANNVEAVTDSIANGEVRLSQTHPSGHNRNALHIAAGNCALDTFRVLYEHMESDMVPDADGFTVLHYAVLTWKNINMLTQTGDAWKTVPVDEVTNPDAYEMVRFLAELGVSLSERSNAEKLTPLHCAAMVGHLDIFSFFLSELGDPNILDGLKRSPLHLAVWANRENIQAFLLARNANLELRNMRGRTPLHVAAVYGRSNMCRRLIAAGANVDSQEVSGDTCLISALKDHFRETASVFIENGADEMVANNEGHNALFYAIHNFPELAHQILDKRRIVKKSQIYGDRCEASYNFRGLEHEIDQIAEGCKKGFFSHRVHTTAPTMSPLELIVSAPSGDLSLLSHPVVVRLLERKWTVFAARNFYGQVARYLLFLWLWMFVHTTEEPNTYHLDDTSDQLRLAAESMVVVGALVYLFAALRVLYGPWRRAVSLLLGGPAINCSTWSHCWLLCLSELHQ